MLILLWSPGVSADVTPLELLTDVAGADASKFDAKDNLGVGLDTIKIIENPSGGYLGVYHHLLSGEFAVRLAASDDLLNWTFQATLAANSSQPTLAYHALTGGFFHVYEQWMSPGSTGAQHIKVRYYPSLNDLNNATPSVSFVAPHSSFNPSNLEGTPNIYSVSDDGSTLEIGFHYFDSTISKDRNARGLLTDFFGESPAWDTQVEFAYNDALIAMGVGGNIGDRDHGLLYGKEYSVQEGQLVQFDFGSWRSYLYDFQADSFSFLDAQTPGGSTAFGNPTFTVLTLPSGNPGVVASYFLFSEGAAPGEAGVLIFFRECEAAAWDPLDPDNVFVDFGAGVNGNGASTSPFDNLTNAVTAAAADASPTINMETGFSLETFTGGNEISKTLTLRNNSPVDGSVIVGGVMARGVAGAQKSGFVSRPEKF